MSGVYRGEPIVTLVNNQSVGVSTSYTVSSTIIARVFRNLEIVFSNFSHTDASNRSFRIELSGDNGGAWSTASAITSSVAASALVSGMVTIVGCDVSGSTSRHMFSTAANEGGATNASVITAAITAVGPINAIRLSPGAGSFDGGTISITGWA